MSDDQIVEAVEQWVKKHPNPGTKVLLVGRKKYSPNDIVKHMKKGDKIGKQFKKDIVQLSTDLLLGK